MKLVFLCNNFKSVNGVERIWSQKLSLLADYVDYQIYLITYNQYGALLSFPISDKVHHIDLSTRYISRCSFHGLGQYFDRYKSERSFRRILRDCLISIRPDVVTCTDMHLADLKALLNLDFPVVRVVECHCGRAAYFNDLKKFKGIFHFIKQYLLKIRLLHAIYRFDHIIVMTEAECKDWRYRDKVKTIPNFLSYYPSKNPRLNINNRKVISVGRYAYQKGYDLLLKAWKNVESIHPEWSLDIYGSCDGGNGEFEQLQKQILTDGLKTVTLHSAEEDIYKAYLESDFYVMSSRFESFGLVLIEAMACGLPIISYDCPYGPSSIIKDGVTGKIVYGFDVICLAETICWMIEHPSERIVMGHNCQQESLKYLSDQIMPLWLKFYKSL